MGISSLATKYGFQSFPHYHRDVVGRRSIKSSSITWQARTMTSCQVSGRPVRPQRITGLAKTEKFVPMWMKTIRHGTRVTGMPISRVLGLKTATPMAHHHGV